MAIWQISELKTALGIPQENTEWDDLLDVLRKSAQEFLQSEIGCPLELAEYNNVELRGNNSYLLALPAWPVEEVISIEDEFGTVYEQGEDFDYDSRDGVLLKLFGMWYRNTRYYVSFRAGFDFAAGEGSDLKALALELIARHWKKFRDKSYGETSRTFPDGSVNYAELNLTETQKKIIQNHKRYLL